MGAFIADLGSRSAAARDAAAGRGGRASCRIRRSAQRRHGLAGIEQPIGVERALDARESARARRGANCTHICAIFSTPTPCSPVIVPPTSMQSSRIAAPNASVRSDLAGDVGVEQDQRMQVAVAGMEHVRAAQAEFRATAPRCAAAPRASARARDRAVDAVVVGRDAARPPETPPCAPTRTAAAAPRPCDTRISVAPLAVEHARDLRHLGGDLLRRAVGLDQQHGRRVERIAGVHELLDRARRQLVHHLEARPG